MRGRRRGLPRLIAALIIGLLGALWQRTRSATDAPASAPASSPTATETRTAPAATAETPRTAPQASAPAGTRSSIGFKSRQRLVEHFEKHGADFPGFTMAQYLGAAQSLRDRPVGGSVLESVRSDGVITRFDRDQGAFLAVEPSGHIRTFFRPNDGEAYFRRQLRRRPESSR